MPGRAGGRPDPRRRPRADGPRTATVFSSGNSIGPNDGDPTAGINFPACIAEAVAVGSTYVRDRANLTAPEPVSSFSRAGERLDLLAPGESVFSSVPGGGISLDYGTSMAAPHVTGAWASFRERNGDTSVEAVLARMQATGRRIDDGRFTPARTWTRLDVSGASAAWGFVLGTNPPVGIEYAPDLQGNSAGGVNRVAKLATGVYIVLMPGLANGTQESGAGGGDRAGQQCRLRGDAAVPQRPAPTGRYHVRSGDRGELDPVPEDRRRPLRGADPERGHVGDGLGLAHEAYGTNTHTCSTADARPDAGNNLLVIVQCREPSGAPVNATFTVQTATEL